MSPRRMKSVHGLPALVAFGLLVATAVAELPAPLSYRRVFVPQDALESQIRGQLPLKRDEFERRLADLAAAGDPATGRATTQIANLTLRALLTGDRLVEGQAELEVVLRGDGPALLALDPWNLVLESATWQGSETQPAVVGADPSGKLHCLVERSGRLKLEFSQAAAAIGPDVTTFDLQVPFAPRRRLEITTGANVQLTTESGLVISHAASADHPDSQLWTIELTGEPLTRLQASTTASHRDAQPLVIARESASYTVLGSAVDVETELALEALHEPVKQIELHVDAALDVTAVRMADQTLPLRTTAGTGKYKAVIVELPEPLERAEQVLAVAASCEWPATGPWILPRIKLGSGVMQQGRTRVNAPAWMWLRATAAGGCIQTQVLPAAAGRSSDQFEFQLLEPDAAIEIVSQSSAAPLLEQSGTQITVDSNQVSGVLIAELTPLAASQFQIEAQVPRQWIIDSVETQPADMLADRALSAHGAEPHHLQIKLARSMSAQRPLRLVIRGHYRRPANHQPLDDDFFHLARFPAARDSRRLVALRVNEPSTELRLLGDDPPPRLDPAQVSAAEARMFESPPGPLLFDQSRQGRRVQAMLQPATSQYQADVVVRADVGRESVEETVSIHCRPQSSAVGSLIVRMAPRPHGDLKWRLVGDESRELSALLETPPAAAGSPDAVMYRLFLPRSQSAAFEIRCQWSQSRTTADDVSLASLPEAHRQTGLVEIHAAESSLHIQTTQVQPLPRPPSQNDRLTTLRGRYRYEAGRRGKITIEAAPAGIAQQGAWIETLKLESHFSDGGGGEHEATFTIHNAGLDAFAMRLAGDVRNCHLVTDDGEQTLASVGSENQIHVPLPPRERRAVVRVRYTTSGTALGFWPALVLATSVPQPDLPVLGRTWKVVLPPDLAATQRTAPPTNRDQQPAATPPVRTWYRILAGPELARSLSLFGFPSGESSAEAWYRGWNALELELPPGPEASLAVYRPGVSRAWSLCLALAAAALVLRWKATARWAAPCAVVLAAVAIACDPPISGLAAGAGLGLLVGSALALLRRPVSAPRRLSVPRPPSALVFPPAQTAGCIVLLLVVAAARCLVSAPEDSRPRVTAGRARVVITVDENQQPAGDYVYLDPQLYDQLHKLNDTRRADQPPWLLERATYQVTAGPTLQPGSAAIDELRATFDIHTFESSAAVNLPLRRDQVLLLEGRARLDGRPATLVWQPDGQSISLTVATTGRHRIELALGAMPRRAEGAVALDVAIPPAAISTVFLPAGGQLASPAARSAMANGTGSFRLASASRLEIRWPTNEAATTALHRDAEQLLSWRVRPGSVTVEGRFSLRANGGPLREALIEVDPRLRLLPAAASGPIGRVRVEEGTLNLVKIELAEPAAAEAQFRLTWLWPDAAGMGRLLLPNVRLIADRVTRDWAAISVEPGLEISRLSEVGEAPSAGDFATVWGESAAPAAIVFGALPTDSYRAIVVQPTTVPPQAQQTLDWSVSSQRASAICTFKLTGVAATRFEHRLSLPPQLKAHRVTLSQGGRSASIRWTQQADGAMVVTLMEPPAAEQSIQLEAQMPLAANRPQFRLPQVSLEDVSHRDIRLRIFRQRDVQLTVQPSANWRYNDAQLGSYQMGTGRLVADLTGGSASGAQPVVTRSPNRPKIGGKMFIHAHQADGDWRGEANLELEVAGGVLDELRLSIPEEWAGPLEVEPAMEQHIAAIPGEPRKELTLRPREAISGRLNLAIRGPLHTGPSGVQAPDVALVGEEKIERLVLLDRGSPSERIDWETTGLLAGGAGAVAALPAAWRDMGGDVYRALAARFDATARARQTTAAAPRVHLADLQATLRPGRRISVVALLTIQPAGARDITFSLPPGCRLVQALVDGIATPCVAGGLRSWTLPAPSDVLPFRLTIVFDSSLPASAGKLSAIRLQAPQLVGMQVEQSLWSVRGEGSEPMRPIDVPMAMANAGGHPLHPISTWQAEFARLQGASLAIDDIVAAQGSNVPASVVGESFVRWQRTLNVNRQRLADMLDEPDVPPTAAERLQAATDAAAKAAQRLIQAGIIDETEGSASVSTGPDEERPRELHLLVPGSAEEVELSWQPASAGIWPGRASAAWLLGIAAIAIWVAGRSPMVQTWLARHACFVLGVAAFAWWLFAPFGWLGWPVVLAALWLSLRPPPRQRIPHAASTIHRISTSSLR